MDKVVIDSVVALARMPFLIENVTMMRAKVTPPSSFKCHKGWRRVCRFFYVIKGTFKVKTVKGNNIEANSGDIIYLPSDVEYESEWLVGGECEYISLECIIRKPDGMEVIIGDDMHIICSDKTEKIFKSMLNMYEYFSSNSISSHLRIISNIHSFIGDIIEDVEKQESKNISIVSTIYKGILYIEENYKKDILINDVARLCNMSESTFRRRFFSHFGMSPYDYINSLKIQKAKELLDSGMYSVKEVAAFLNFYDTSHFNKFFKKYCKIAPSLYNSD